MRLIEVLSPNIASPTLNQKRVLARIVSAPTSRVAATDMNGNQNLVAARDMLMKLGMVSLLNGEMELTDRGMLVAQQENIIDQTGQLTPDGEKLVYGNQPETQEEETDSGYDLEDARLAPYDPAALAPPVSPESGYGESFSLLKQLI